MKRSKSYYVVLGLLALVTIVNVSIFVLYPNRTYAMLNLIVSCFAAFAAGYMMADLW